MIVPEKSKSISNFCLKKDFSPIKKWIISSGKMRNLGNYIYDYAHSFFGKDF